MIKFGDINIIGVFFGDIPITSAFKGEDLVYKTGGSYPKDALVLKAVNKDEVRIPMEYLDLDRIDWGDGTIDNYTSHSYSKEGDYIILAFFNSFYEPAKLIFDDPLYNVDEIIQFPEGGRFSLYGNYNTRSNLTNFAGSLITNFDYFCYFNENVVPIFGSMPNCEAFRMDGYNSSIQCKKAEFRDFKLANNCYFGGADIRLTATEYIGHLDLSNVTVDTEAVVLSEHYTKKLEKFSLPKPSSSLTMFSGIKNYNNLKLAYLTIMNLGQLVNQGMTYNFIDLPAWGDDSIIAGSRQSLVDSLVNNSADVNGKNITLKLTMDVVNRLTDEEYEAILAKGYIVTPAKPKSAKFVLDTNLAPDLNSVELPIRCIAGETSYGYSDIAYLNMNVDWGDGTPIETFNDTARGTTAAPLHTHSYAERKEYTVKVIVTKDEWYGHSWSGTDSYPDTNRCAANFYNTANSCLTKVIRWVDRISTVNLNAEFRHTRNIIEMAPMIWKTMPGGNGFIVDKPFKYLLPSKGDAVLFPYYDENTTITEVELGDFFTKWKWYQDPDHYSTYSPYNNFKGLKHLKGTIDARGTGQYFKVVDSQNSALLKIDKLYINTSNSIYGSIYGAPAHSITVMNIGEVPMADIADAQTNSKGIKYISLYYMGWENWGENTSECPDAKQSLLDSFITYSTPQETPYNVVLSPKVYARFTPEEIAQINAKNIFLGTNRDDFNN